MQQGIADVADTLSLCERSSEEGKVSWRRRLSRTLQRWVEFPRPFVDYRPVQVPLTRRGTDYGGWWFIPTDDLRGGLVVCAGAGEDISFDVALAAEFGATVHIIDPTPRAVHHVEAVLSRIGQRSEAEFVHGGAQPPDAYDVSRVNGKQIVLHRFALWNADTPVTFFPPANPDFVSHTVGDWRNSGRHEDALTVEARRLESILTDEEADRIALLKLDIEGSEIEVLEDIFASGLEPHQVLVEFDQLAEPNNDTLARAKRTFVALKRMNYRLTARDGLNYSFLQSAS